MSCNIFLNTYGNRLDLVSLPIPYYIELNAGIEFVASLLTGKTAFRRIEY